MSKTEELYLVLHKVRGEPAFDIAVRTKIGEEEMWILDTLGWRCYPAAYWPMTSMWVNREFVPGLPRSLPDDLPDCFSANDTLSRIAKARSLPSRREMSLDEILEL